MFLFVWDIIRMSSKNISIDNIDKNSSFHPDATHLPTFRMTKAQVK